MSLAIPAHLRHILDLARWAPSGDNIQNWRLEVLGDEHVLVHGLDTRDHVVYDLDGHASQLAVGALLETMVVAATTQGRRTEISRRTDTPETHLLLDVRFTPDDALVADPLARHIEKRVVQRRPMSLRPLTHQQKSALESALPEGFMVLWFEGAPLRWRLAKLMFDNAKIRLTIPEAYEVHRSVIEWGARFSEDRIPDQAVGVDPVTARLMRWVMASWERVEFFNSYFLGHLPPRIQLDLLPGLFCAAHFALLRETPPLRVDDYLASGRAMQRFWLTAASLGLFLQPEMTPVIFSRYVRQNRRFTRNQTAVRLATKLNLSMQALLGAQELNSIFFMGRMGAGPAPVSRSTRKTLDRLMAG